MIITLFLLALAAALFVGFVIGAIGGHRFEVANQRIAGFLAAAERDTAVCDASADAETAADWGGEL